MALLSPASAARSHQSRAAPRSSPTTISPRPFIAPTWPVSAARSYQPRAAAGSSSSSSTPTLNMARALPLSASGMRARTATSTFAAWYAAEPMASRSSSVAYAIAQFQTLSGTLMAEVRWS